MPGTVLPHWEQFGLSPAQGHLSMLTVGAGILTANPLIIILLHALPTIIINLNVLTFTQSVLFNLQTLNVVTLNEYIV